jgi:hypothetical protein
MNERTQEAVRAMCAMASFWFVFSTMDIILNWIVAITRGWAA